MKKIYWFIDTQLGLNLRRTYRAFAALPRFVNDLLSFIKVYKGRLTLLPCLHDRFEEGGFTKDEYFWQDLYVARKIYAVNPQKHVDIGSRVDGFVTHVASFREIEVFDIRPITACISGVTFKQADLMSSAIDITNYCDSLSCLHALEHFGLGRYGDPVDPNGYKIGLHNMANILRPGGMFYLSVPVGIERVEFNANRVFNPNSIVDIAATNQLELREFVLFSADNGLVHTDATYETLSNIGKNRYALGIFTFFKKNKE